MVDLVYNKFIIFWYSIIAFAILLIALFEAVFSVSKVD